MAALQAAAEPDSVAGLILIDPALPTSRPGFVHPRVIANFLLCAVPGVGQTYLSQRRRRTTPEQTVRRVLEVCCVDASRVPPEVVEAHVELTARLDRVRADDAYLRSARSLSLMMAYPGDADAAARRHRTAHPAASTAPATCWSRCPPPAGWAPPTREWRFEIAPDTGHVPMLEAPQWTTAVIEDWMAAEGEPAVGRASAAPYASADSVG